MVTLTGDLVEKSGAMRGGFLKTKGRAGALLKRTYSDISKYESELGSLQGLISNLEDKNTENEEQIIRLRELKANLEGDIIKTEKSLHLDSEDLDVSLKLKDEFKDKLREVDKEFMGIQQEISKENRELAQFKISRQKLRDKITELRNPTKLAELNTFEQRLSKLKEEKIELEGKLKNTQSQVTNILEPEKENIEKILKQQEKKNKISKKNKKRSNQV